MFRYFFRAEFANGPALTQPVDDASVLKPGEKSAGYDLAQMSAERRLVYLELVGPERDVGLLVPARQFSVDGREVEIGDPLPEGCEWVEGDPAQGNYFRRVTKTYSGELECLATDIQFCIGLKAEPGVRNFLGVR